MDDRRTHIRRDEDLDRHKADECFFYREKGTYEQMIKEQQTLNSAIMDMLTSLNDNLQEYKEAGSEENREMLDQVNLHIGILLERIQTTDAHDALQNTQIAAILKALEETRSYVNMQMDDGAIYSDKITQLDTKLTAVCGALNDLKADLNNGYADKLVARIKSDVDGLSKRTEDNVASRMTGLAEDVVRSTLRKGEYGQKMLWHWLIRISMAGGILYLAIDRLLGGK